MKRKRNSIACSECGESFAATKNSVQDHTVNKHGYMREGAQVFKRIPCIACVKPALYKVGGVGYCKDHKHLGVERRKIVGSYLGVRSSRFSKERKESDYVTLAKIASKRTGKNFK